MSSYVPAALTAMGCRQCLLLSVVQLKGKHCGKPHGRNGVVDMFGLCYCTCASVVNYFLHKLGVIHLGQCQGT